MGHKQTTIEEDYYYFADLQWFSFDGFVPFFLLSLSSSRHLLSVAPQTLTNIVK